MTTPCTGSSPFHGGNRGSNPLRDAIKSNTYAQPNRWYPISVQQKIRVAFRQEAIGAWFPRKGSCCSLIAPRSHQALLNSNCAVDVDGLRSPSFDGLNVVPPSSQRSGELLLCLQPTLLITI